MTANNKSFAEKIVSAAGGLYVAALVLVVIFSKDIYAGVRDGYRSSMYTTLHGAFREEFPSFNQNTAAAFATSASTCFTEEVFDKEVERLDVIIWLATLTLVDPVDKDFQVPQAIADKCFGMGLASAGVRGIENTIDAVLRFLTQ